MQLVKKAFDIESETLAKRQALQNEAAEAAARGRCSQRQR